MTLVFRERLARELVLVNNVINIETALHYITLHTHYKSFCFFLLLFKYAKFVCFISLLIWFTMFLCSFVCIFIMIALLLFFKVNITVSQSNP